MPTIEQLSGVLEQKNVFIVKHYFEQKSSKKRGMY